MKIKFLRFCLCFFGCLSVAVYAKADSGTPGNDTNEVKKMNRQAFASRLTNPDQTIKLATKALALATKLDYPEGMAEANRELGIGYYISNKPDSAIQFYLTAKKIYEENHNLKGVARILNNIGNLYRETDDLQSIKYFNDALQIALKIKDQSLIGSIYLNIGNGYNNAFNQAQQAQQFGANLGLQGQQAQAGALASQMSGANQLAGLGGQQLAALIAQEKEQYSMHRREKRHHWEMKLLVPS